MVVGLALAVLVLSSADHWTTYLCLRGPVEGFDVTEANPLAAWLFDTLGLLPGLAIDALVTLAAVAFLVVTHRLPDPVKLLFLVGVAAWTASAVTNNMNALRDLGISPLAAF